jgi:hypothetical protein
MTQSQRALVGFGALLIAASLVLTLAWDIALRRRRDWLTSRRCCRTQVFGSGRSAAASYSERLKQNAIR